MFDRIFVKLTGHPSQNISEKYDVRRDWTVSFRTTCAGAPKTFPIHLE